MVKCRECKARISRSANACPQCGAKNPAKGKIEHGLNETSNALMKAGCLLVLLAVLAMLAVGLLGT